MQAFYETLNVTPIFNCIYIHSECRSESIPNHYKLMLDVSIMFIQNADQYPTTTIPESGEECIVLQKIRRKRTRVINNTVDHM